MKYTNRENLIALWSEAEDKGAAILATAQDSNAPLWVLYRAYRTAHEWEGVSPEAWREITKAILHNPALPLLQLEDPVTVKKLVDEIHFNKEPERDVKALTHIEIPEPLEEKPCSHCGEAITAHPWPCMDWGCANSNHLVETCPSEFAVEYRSKLSKKRLRATEKEGADAT